jgi:hypothetical protein
LGIYHYGARFYSPKTGTFLSADTIVPGYANPQNLNRYSYVRNSPLNYIDPTGHKPACGVYGEECAEDELDALISGGGSGGGGSGGGGGGGQPSLNPALGGNCGAGNYSPHCPGWHFYTTTNLVCPAYLHCTREEMKYYLLLFAYPGQDPLRGPVHSGGYYNVSDPWHNILPRNIGPIVTYVSSDGLTISNVTRPGHILHDGRIDRTAFLGPDGAWYVTTYGYGNNEQREVFDAQRPDLPPITADLASVNLWGGKAIFNQVDEQMLNYIVGDHR